MWFFLFRQKKQIFEEIIFNRFSNCAKSPFHWRSIEVFKTKKKYVIFRKVSSNMNDWKKKYSFLFYFNSTKNKSKRMRSIFSIYWTFLSMDIFFDCSRLIQICRTNILLITFKQRNSFTLFFSFILFLQKEKILFIFRI